MTAALFAKSSTESTLQHNGVDVVTYGAGGIVSGFGRNVLINSNFGVNQRTVSGTVTLAAGIYGHDRWKAGASGCTYTFATALGVTTLTISAGSLIQVVEGAQLQSGAVVLGWNGTAQGKIDAGAYGASGVTGTATGGTNMSVEFGTGTLNLPKLETGSLKSAWSPYQGIYGGELQACQRYLPAYAVQTGNGELQIATGQCFSSTAAIINYGFQVQPRVPPTGLSASSAGHFLITSSVGGLLTTTALAFVGSTLVACEFSASVTSGLAAGNATMFRSGNGSAQLLFTGCEL